MFERACLVDHFDEKHALMVLTMETRECPNTHVQAERLMAISGRVCEDMTATYNPPDIVQSLMAGHPTFSGSSDSLGGNMCRPQQRDLAAWSRGHSLVSLSSSVSPLESKRFTADSATADPSDHHAYSSYTVSYVTLEDIDRSSLAEIYTSIVLVMEADEGPNTQDKALRGE